MHRKTQFTQLSTFNCVLIVSPGWLVGESSYCDHPRTALRPLNNSKCRRAPSSFCQIKLKVPTRTICDSPKCRCTPLRIRSGLCTAPLLIVRLLACVICDSHPVIISAQSISTLRACFPSQSNSKCRRAPFSYPQSVDVRHF